MIEGAIDPIPSGGVFLCCFGGNAFHGQSLHRGGWDKQIQRLLEGPKLVKLITSIRTASSAIIDELRGAACQGLSVNLLSS